MKRTCKKRNNAGVTLLELMIVIAVAAILAAMAAPSFNELIRDMRMSSASNQLFVDLNQARSEAIKRNTWVLVCANPGGTNPTDCAAATNWTNGWLICSGTNATGTAVCDVSTTVNPNPIIVRGAVHSTLVFSGNPAIGVRFNANGTADVARDLAIKGNWIGTKTRTQSISVTGNIRSSKSS